MRHDGRCSCSLLRRTAQSARDCSRDRRTLPAAGGRRRRDHASTGATYIWGVNNGRVVETSLGYFINPLVTVLMGVFILGERLRPLQWVAMGDRRRRGRRAHRRLRPAAVDRAGRWRSRSAPTGWPRRRPTSGPSRASPSRPRDRAVRARRTSAGWSRTGESTFATDGAGHALLLAAHRHRHRDPADLLRRRGDPGPDGDARPAAVPRPDPAVRPRRPVLPRGTCPPAAGSASGWSGSRW